MGLTIRCLTDIKEVPESEVEDLDIEGVRTFYCNNHEEYLSRIRNLKNNTYYSCESHGTNISYPYSYHSKFRVELMKLSNNIKSLKPSNEPERHELDVDFDKMLPEDEFYELVFFSDCDGHIDWECCGRILSDFKKYENVVDNLPEISHCHFKERFGYWIETLEFCYENKGVIEFS